MAQLFSGCETRRHVLQSAPPQKSLKNKVRRARFRTRHFQRDISISIDYVCSWTHAKELTLISNLSRTLTPSLPFPASYQLRGSLHPCHTLHERGAHGKGQHLAELAPLKCKQLAVLHCLRHACTEGRRTPREGSWFIRRMGRKAEMHAKRTGGENAKHLGVEMPAKRQQSSLEQRSSSVSAASISSIFGRNCLHDAQTCDLRLLDVLCGNPINTRECQAKRGVLRAKPDTGCGGLGRAPTVHCFRQ